MSGPFIVRSASMAWLQFSAFVTEVRRGTNRCVQVGGLGRIVRLNESFVRVIKKLFVFFLLELEDFVK